MHKKLAVAMLLAIGSSSVWAQEAPRSDAPASSPVPPATMTSADAGASTFTTGPYCDFESYEGGGTQLYGRGEFLLWWTQGMSIPPLVTTSPAGTARAQAGVLGAPGTAILFGGNRVEDDLRPGVRVTLGSWLGCDQQFAIEASFFYLDPDGFGYRAASGGSQILARPFFNTATGAAASELVSFPGVLSGAVAAYGSTSVWGGEINGRTNLCCGCESRVDAIVGYRYLRLHDRLSITEDLTAIGPGQVPAGTRFNILDRFNTTNNFNGGQVGLIGEVRRNSFYLEGLVKVALGCTHQGLDIQGATLQSVPGLAPTVGAGGLLALPTNIGSYSRNRFSVVPELGVHAGYQLSDNLRAFVGYTFLYWNNVARAGGQVDVVVNPTQLPPGTLVGPRRPAAIFNDSDFWAQGFDFGVEFRF